MSKGTFCATKGRDKTSLLNMMEILKKKKKLVLCTLSFHPTFPVPENGAFAKLFHEAIFSAKIVLPLMLIAI